MQLRFQSLYSHRRLRVDDGLGWRQVSVPVHRSTGVVVDTGGGFETLFDDDKVLHNIFEHQCRVGQDMP